MECTIEWATVPGFGLVEKVYIEGRWVGMVYRDRNPPPELDELWMAYYKGGRAAHSRDEAI